MTRHRACTILSFLLVGGCATHSARLASGADSHTNGISSRNGPLDLQTTVASSQAIALQAQGNVVLSEPESSLPMLPPKHVWMYRDGVRRAIPEQKARTLGLTIIDLSDDWTPYIFSNRTPGKQDFKRNHYASTYRTLAKNAKAYLEVWGIAPSLTAVRSRFVSDARKRCFDALDINTFRTYRGAVRIADAGASKRFMRRYRRLHAAFRSALRSAHATTLDQLLLSKKSTYRRIARRYQKVQWQREAIREAQQRLVCEGLLPKTALRKDTVNWHIRSALKRFERKHNIYGRGYLTRTTVQALGRTPQQNNYRSLRRAIAARVIAATGAVEDGSSSATYVGVDGNSHHVRNMVDELVDATLYHLRITNAEQAEAFLRNHTAAQLRKLRVALPLPELPEYYSNHMDLSIEVDRGDVSYGLPYSRQKRRKRLPRFSLFTTYRGQKIALVHWSTTIGGWKRETRDNEEYYRYKHSDIGRRSWKHVIAGPVWMPPKSTPPRELVKRWGKHHRIKSKTFGPSYASAYGLVAAPHVTASGIDNQIRTHGTSNYLSVEKGFSHGCHRLHNHNAVRLFSFVLRHRRFVREGQQRASYRHAFNYQGRSYAIKLKTRGYQYALTPPVPVNVLKGRILSRRKRPYRGYVRHRKTVYQADLPKAHATRTSAVVHQVQTL